MPDIMKALRDNIPYAYMALGVVWLVVAFVSASWFLLWPVAACILGGLLLWRMPRTRLSWAWATAAAVMGLVLAVYQAYVAIPLVSGAFSTVGGESLALFAVFAVGHLLVLYVENVGGTK